MREAPDGEPPDLSVVIPARNAGATLPVQLAALTGQEWSGTWEIVVVDNGSTDGTAEMALAASERDKRVRVVEAPDCHGAAAVRNAGFSLVRGRAVAMCDADDVVGPHWVKAMGDALAVHPCVTGPLEVRDCNPQWLVRTRGVPRHDRPGTFHGLFPLLPAGNFGMRRDVWKRVGGFDEALIANEDADLSLRLWHAGIAVEFALDAIVHYRYRTSSRDLFSQGMAYGTFRALVVKRARALGLRVPHVSGWRSWLMLVLWLPRMFTREGRASWSWVAGVRLGLLRGCLRFRVVYL